MAFNWFEQDPLWRMAYQIRPYRWNWAEILGLILSGLGDISRAQHQQNVENAMRIIQMWPNLSLETQQRYLQDPNFQSALRAIGLPGAQLAITPPPTTPYKDYVRIVQKRDLTPEESRYADLPWQDAIAAINRERETRPEIIRQSLIQQRDSLLRSADQWRQNRQPLPDALVRQIQEFNARANELNRQYGSTVVQPIELVQSDFGVTIREQPIQVTGPAARVYREYAGTTQEIIRTPEPIRGYYAPETGPLPAPPQPQRTQVRTFTYGEYLQTTAPERYRIAQERGLGHILAMPVPLDKNGNVDLNFLMRLNNALDNALRATDSHRSDIIRSARGLVSQGRYEEAAKLLEDAASRGYFTKDEAAGLLADLTREVTGRQDQGRFNRYREAAKGYIRRGDADGLQRLVNIWAREARVPPEVIIGIIYSISEDIRKERIQMGLAVAREERAARRERIQQPPQNRLLQRVEQQRLDAYVKLQEAQAALRELESRVQDADRRLQQELGPDEYNRIRYGSLRQGERNWEQRIDAMLGSGTVKRWNQLRQRITELENRLRILGAIEGSLAPGGEQPQPLPAPSPSRRPAAPQPRPAAPQPLPPAPQQTGGQRFLQTAAVQAVVRQARRYTNRMAMIEYLRKAWPRLNAEQRAAVAESLGLSAEELRMLGTGR